MILYEHEIRMMYRAGNGSLETCQRICHITGMPVLNIVRLCTSPEVIPKVGRQAIPYHPESTLAKGPSVDLSKYKRVPISGGHNDRAGN